MNFICDPELKLNVQYLDQSDFENANTMDMLMMLRHTANNPLDLGSGVCRGTLVFESGRIHDMAVHLEGSEVGKDFALLSGILRKQAVDILEVVVDIAHPLNT